MGLNDGANGGAELRLRILHQCSMVPALEAASVLTSC